MSVSSPPDTDFEVTRADFLRYAGAAGDYHPLHTDEEYARAAGMPSVFAHGMYSAGLLSTAISRWAGMGNVLRLRVRFVGKTWPDDRLTTSIVVTGTRPAAPENGSDQQVLVDFACTLTSSHGDVKVKGDGTARLRSEAT